MNRDEITKTVTQIIARSLALEVEEVNSDSRVVDDLGMDSLDFLDIMFSLEKAFGTKIRDPQVDGFLRPNRSSDAPLDEFLSEDEVAEMAVIMPSIAEAAKQGRVARNRIFSFVTVDSVVRIVEQKLEAKQ